MRRARTEARARDRTVKSWQVAALVALVLLLLVLGGETAVVVSRGRDMDAMIDALAKWEGETDYLYQDSRGLVTVGIGNLVKDADAAAALTWNDGSGSSASEQLVRSDWQSVADASKGHAASYYEPLTQIRLPAGGARALAQQRLETEFLPGLRELFPSFDSYPDSAKAALVDMAYNLGVHGLAAFRTLRTAAEAGDWQAAALASHVKTSRDDRNDWRAEQLAAAAGATA